MRYALRCANLSSGYLHKQMDLTHIIAGALVGTLVGLTGVGGGSLMTPLLVFLFGFHPAVAVGTDLLFAAITKSVGAVVHHNSHRSVNWRIATRLSLGSIPAAILSIIILKIFESSGTDLSRPITKVLGTALILTAAAIIIKPKTQEVKRKLPNSTVRFLGEHRRLATIVVGSMLGCLVTLSSVGAGALGTVALLFLYPGLPAVKVVGTDLAYAIPLATVAGLGHWYLGNIDWSLLLTLLIGSVPGIWLGSHISAKLPDRVLRPILATILFLVALKCLVS